MICGGCGSETDETGSNSAVPVKTEKVISEQISIPVHTSGKLFSSAETKLSFKIGGIIDDIYVTEGQSVKKGQLLAKLKQEEIGALATQARSGFEKAERDFQRVKNLYADSVATLEQIENARTALDMARSNMEIAEFNLRHSAIYAPTKGKILKRFAEQNELIAPGSPVFFFGSGNNEWVVRVGVTDRDIILLRLNDSASVAFDVYRDEKFPGRVAEIAESADPMNGTYEVELTIPQSRYKFVSGFVASVDIFPSRKQSYFIIPAAALIEADANEGYVYTVNHNDNSVEKVKIEIGHIFDDKIAVASGLENTARVITDGSSYLTDGSTIKIIN